MSPTVGKDMGLIGGLTISPVIETTLERIINNPCRKNCTYYSSNCLYQIRWLSVGYSATPMEYAYIR
jgi:hypothetical protein